MFSWLLFIEFERFIMKLKSLLSTLFLLLFPFFVEAQCAMCRAVLESSGNKAQAEGINEGIMYLMVWPYLLIGGLGFFAWWSLKKQTKSQEEGS